jgi:RHS repeat-associated protein
MLGYADSETGLTLFGERYYDSSTGRWVNRDPRWLFDEFVRTMLDGVPARHEEDYSVN